MQIDANLHVPFPLLLDLEEWGSQQEKNPCIEAISRGSTPPPLGIWLLYYSDSGISVHWEACWIKKSAKQYSPIDF